ncbi:MAG: DUF1559 domain-containing protein [Pirellulales bacterium]
MRRILSLAAILLSTASISGCGSSTPTAPGSPPQTSADPAAAAAAAAPAAQPPVAASDAPVPAAPAPDATAATAAPPSPVVGPKIVDSISLPPPTAGTTAGATAESAGPLDTTFIPADAFAALVVHPSQILAAPELQPLRPMLGPRLAQSGMDLAQIEQLRQIVLVFGKGQAGPEAYGGVFRFTEPPAQDQWLASMSPGAQQVTQEMTTYFRAASPQRPSLSFVDDRTLVFGLEPKLLAMLAAKDVDSPLIQQLGTLDTSNILLAACVLDPVRADIQAAISQRPLPAQYAEYAKMPDYISSIAVSFTMTTLEIDVIAKDEQSATALAGLLESGKQLVLQFLDVAQQLQQQLPPEQKAGVELAQKQTRELIAQFNPRVEGNHLRVHLQSAVSGSDAAAAAALLPAIQAARDAAGRSVSTNNLKQIGAALLKHHETHKKLPAAASFDAGGTPLLSWRVHLLPMLGQEALYKEFKLNEAWDSPHNQTLIARMPEVYANPSLQVEPGHTTYVLIAGEGTAFNGREGTPLGSITDGAASTLVVVEANPEYAIAWTRPLDLSFPSFEPSAVVGKVRPGGFLGLFADGSARLVKTLTDEVFRGLCTRAGNEVIPPGTLDP